MIGWDEWFPTGASPKLVLEHAALNFFRTCRGREDWKRFRRRRTSWPVAPASSWREPRLPEHKENCTISFWKLRIFLGKIQDIILARESAHRFYKKTDKLDGNKFGVNSILIHLIWKIINYHIFNLLINISNNKQFYHPPKKNRE